MWSGVQICGYIKLLPILTTGCAFTASQKENSYCIDIFFMAYQICRYSSILSWVKNGSAATAIIGKVSPLHLILNRRRMFFCNKLHKDIITQKSP